MAPAPAGRARRRPRPSRDPPRPPRLPPARAPPPAHGGGRGRHPLPLPDLRLVQGAPAAAAPAARLVPRRVSRAPAAALLLPPAVPGDVGAGPASSGMPVAFKLGTALAVFLLPLLAYAAFRLMGFRFPGPLLGAGGGARVPLPRGQPDLGRHHREHPDRRVLVHLRHRPRRPVPRRRLSRLQPRPRALGSGRAPRPRGLRPRLRGAVGRSRLIYFPLRLATALAHPASAGCCGRGPGLRPRGPPPRAPALRLGLHDALQRPLDHGHHPRPGPAVPVAAPRLAGALALVGTLAARARAGGPDHRLLFLGYAALVGAALAAAGPPSASIDVRFVPFAQLAACLAGAAARPGPRARLALATWPPSASSSCPALRRRAART